MAGVGITHWR